MSLGDHPPLEALPSDALSKADYIFLLEGLQKLWRGYDDLRQDLTPPHDQPYIDKQLELEAVGDKLRARLKAMP